MSLLSLATTKPATTTADSLLVTITPGRGKKVVVHGAGITASQGTKIAEALQTLASSRERTLIM